MLLEIKEMFVKAMRYNFISIKLAKIIYAIYTHKTMSIISNKHRSERSRSLPTLLIT